ncbi:MAG: PilZ domain-containing protein [Clostridia bacterium]|nr:PilZ domain-containing protein [Deltaproteobacteria bacterium]
MTSALRKFDESTSTPTPVLEMPMSTPYSGQQNRRFMPRTRASFSAMVDGERLTGIDVSFGGCMVVATYPVWPGNTVDVALLLDGTKHPIETRGTVVDLVTMDGRVGMRIQFDDLSTSRRKDIAMWMAERAEASRL